MTQTTQVDSMDDKGLSSAEVAMICVTVLGVVGLIVIACLTYYGGGNIAEIASFVLAIGGLITAFVSGRTVLKMKNGKNDSNKTNESNDDE